MVDAVVGRVANYAHSNVCRIEFVLFLCIRAARFRLLSTRLAYQAAFWKVRQHNFLLQIALAVEVRRLDVDAAVGIGASNEQNVGGQFFVGRNVDEIADEHELPERFAEASFNAASRHILSTDESRRASPVIDVNSRVVEATIGALSAPIFGGVFDGGRRPNDGCKQVQSVGHRRSLLTYRLESFQDILRMLGAPDTSS